MPMYRFVGALLILSVLDACGGGGSTVTSPPPAPVATVTLNQSALTLTPPQTATLVATAKDADGNVLTGRTITWASSAAAVASVDATGVVTAVSAGSAQVTATSEGKGASATITVSLVIAPVASITLNQSTAGLVPLQTVSLTATPKDAAGNSLGGRTIAWSSSLSTVASVDNNGVVTAAAVGSATITASSEGKSATATITVSPGAFLTPAGGVATAFSGNVTVTIPAGALTSATAITIAQTVSPLASVLLIPGTAYDFGPAGTTFAVPVTLQIKYDPALVPAGTEALLRLHKLIAGVWTLVAGSTVNTTTKVVTGVTSGFSTYAILRLPPVATVAITPSPLDLPLGMQVQLVATTKDAQGNPLTGRAVGWGSSAGNVATIDGAGLVTSVATGATTVTASSEGIPGTLLINVRRDPSQRTMVVSSGNGGLSHTVCLIGIDQHGYCYGTDEFGLGNIGDGTSRSRRRPTPITLNQSLIALALSDQTSCAIDVSTNLWCWGSNNGEFATQSPSRSAVPIQVAISRHWVDMAITKFDAMCAIDNTAATYCWGAPLLFSGPTSYVPTRIGNDPGFVSIRGADHTMCGITLVGALYCWGDFIINGAQPTTPTLVTGLPPIASVSIGFLSICAIGMNRAMYCWGAYPGNGQSYSATIVQVPGSWRSSSGGDVATCAVTMDYVTKCMGLGSFGLTGNGAFFEALTPIALPHAPPFAVVAVPGGFAACGLTSDGAGYCWGPRFGLLGDDDNGFTSAPVSVIGAQNAQQVTRGYITGCYVNTGKQLQCWDETARIIVPPFVRDTPVTKTAGTPVFGARTVKAVTYANTFGCYILEADGRVSCWGEGTHGELGNGAGVYSATPVTVTSTRSFTALASAAGSTCALSTLKEIWCWGDTPTGSAVPVQPWGGTNWNSVWGGESDNYCAINDTGTAFCGKLNAPFVAIAGSQHWVEMYSNGGSTCGLADTGLAYCMGINSRGELGDGTTTNRATMTPVSGGFHFTHLAQSGSSACGLIADGSAYCWGYDMPGLPAHPPTFATTTPTLMPGGFHFSALSPSLGCGIVTDGTIACWGQEGSLGDGQLIYRNDPVPMAGGFRFLLYEPGSAFILQALRAAAAAAAAAGGHK